MPYSGPNDPNLPSNVKAAPERLRRQWIGIWEDVLKRTGSEQRAFEIANGWLKKHKYAEGGTSYTFEESYPSAFEIEVFRAGDYTNIGKGVYSEQDVANMASDYDPTFHEAPITLDHKDDGPAYGWVKSLRNCGESLWATVHEMTDDFVQRLQRGQYRKRSVEIWRKWFHTGRPHIAAVSFLGASTPAVKGMSDVIIPVSESGVPDEVCVIESVIGDVGVLSLGNVTVPVKVEDGFNFPAPAFAHVPNSFPNDWALRMTDEPEGPVTLMRLNKAASAISPGGTFRKANPLLDLSSIQSRLRTAYRDLNVADKDMPKWVTAVRSPSSFNDFDSMAVIDGDSSPSSDENVWPVRIIRPGFNSTKSKYYKGEVLERDGPTVFEDVKMWADHPSGGERLERSVQKTWVAILKGVVFADGALRGQAHVIEDWFQRKLLNLKRAKALHHMKASIRGVGEGVRAVVEGFSTIVVERMLKDDVRTSVDFVTYAGAGGQVDIKESAEISILLDSITEDELRERRPDLIDLIESSARQTMDMEVKSRMDEMAELKKKNDALEVEHKALSEKLASAEKDKKVSATKEKVRVALAAITDLSDVTKERILGAFENCENADNLDQVIKTERDYIAKLADVKVKGLGQGSESAPEPGFPKTKAAMVKSYMSRGYSKEQAEKMAESAFSV